MNLSVPIPVTINYVSEPLVIFRNHISFTWTFRVASHISSQSCKWGWGRLNQCNSRRYSIMKTVEEVKKNWQNNVKWLIKKFLTLWARKCTAIWVQIWNWWTGVCFFEWHMKQVCLALWLVMKNELIAIITRAENLYPPQHLPHVTLCEYHLFRLLA